MVTDWQRRQLPRIRGVEGWQGVHIDESGEELVSLRRFHRQVIVDPLYHKWGIPGAVNDCQVRSGLAERLTTAARNLPSGWRFIVWDGWRPFGVQLHLFQRHKRKLKAEHPGSSQASIERRTARHVSEPSRDPTAPAPHNTGGAVDISLIDSSNTPLDLGTPFDHFGARSQTGYFEALEEHGEALSPSDRASSRNRRLLFWALDSAGFANYEAEWWHFDYGDQFWGLKEGRSAIYGIAEPVSWQ